MGHALAAIAVNLKLTEAEKLRWQAAADALGEPLDQFVRLAVERWIVTVALRAVPRSLGPESFKGPDPKPHAKATGDDTPPPKRKKK